MGTAKYYRSTRESVLLQQNTIDCAATEEFYKSAGGCIVIEEYYRNTGEAVLVQQSNIGALEMLCRYRRVLLEHSEDCGGTEEYPRRTGEAVLVQPSTTGALGRPSWYSRVL